MRNAPFGAENPYLEENNNKTLGQTSQEGTVCLLMVGGTKVQSTTYSEAAPHRHKLTLSAQSLRHPSCQHMGRCSQSRASSQKQDKPSWPPIQTSNIVLLNVPVCQNNHDAMEGCWYIYIKNQCDNIREHFLNTRNFVWNITTQTQFLEFIFILALFPHACTFFFPTKL